MQELLAKLKLDGHHRIEWFGVSFSVLSVCMLLVLVSIGVKVHKDASITLSDKAMYTTSFTTSLTGVSGEVRDVYSNKDHTKIFLLLKFSDTSAISMDANEYQMFLTGSSPTQAPTYLNVNPSGCIYMFGSTGYMGIYLSDVRGFEPQILNLIVRCNSQLTSKRSDTAQEALTDASFADYDQFQIYFNAGAANTTKLDILESDDTLKVSDLYYEMLVKADEDSVREQLQADIDAMKLDLDRIEEYRKRLAMENIQVPDDPELIRGDTYTVNDDGSVEINFASILAGGLDFDWKNGSVKTGYLDSLTNGMEYEDYFSELNEERSLDGSNLISSDMQWLTASGEPFTVSNDGGSIVTTKDTTTANDIAGLQQAWRNYYSMKLQYQTADLKELLDIEMDVKSSDAMFSLNNSEDVLTNWQSKE